MLVGYVGDVENDAGDVDGLRSVKCVNFVRQCCRIRYFTGPDEKPKNKSEKDTNPNINPHPILNAPLYCCALSKKKFFVF